MKYTIHTLKNGDWNLYETTGAHWNMVLGRFKRLIADPTHTVETDGKGKASAVVVGDTKYWVTSDWSAPGSLAAFVGNDTEDAIKKYQQLKSDLEDIEAQMSQYATARPSTAASSELTRLTQARDSILAQLGGG